MILHKSGACISR